MSYLERIRNGDPMVTRVCVLLDRDDMNDLVAALSESVHVDHVELRFQAGSGQDGPMPMGELKSLLSYLLHNAALQTVTFVYPMINQLYLASAKRRNVLQAFSQTIQAANANPRVDTVSFAVSLLTAPELISGSFYQSLKCVTLGDHITGAFSETENQAIEQAILAMSSLETLSLLSQQTQRAELLLRALHTHPCLQHLRVAGFKTNMDTAQAMLGLLHSTPLTRLAIYWENGSFNTEEFEIIAQGLEHCPTLVQLELSCPGATEPNLLQAARFFHQCSTVSSIRKLSLGGDWNRSAIVASILSAPSDGSSLPVTTCSIGASLQVLTLDTVSDTILEFLATNTSRLPHLSIKHVGETTWPQLCEILPALIYLQELTVERFHFHRLVEARTAVLQALRANGSLQTVTIGHSPTRPLFTAIELRFIDAFCQRNRMGAVICRLRRENNVVVKDNPVPFEPTCIPFLLQAMQPAQRMTPTVLMAHALGLDSDDMVDRVRRRQHN